MLWESTTIAGAELEANGGHGTTMPEESTSMMRAPSWRPYVSRDTGSF
jgi:hypothetical protein